MSATASSVGWLHSAPRARAEGESGVVAIAWSQRQLMRGPAAPAGFEANWIPSVAGKSWFAYFRFYQPTESYFNKSWPLGDLREIK